MASVFKALVLALLAAPLATASPTSLKIKKRITTPYFQKYVAIGDSYASGIGAGDYTGSWPSENYRCSRFTNAYPKYLHRGLNDPDKRNFQHKACAGATAEQVEAQTVDADADLITISAGGNNVGFSNLIDRCVYHFKVWNTQTCEQAMDETEALIRDDSKLWNPVWNDIWKVYSNLSPLDRRDARLFVTGYPRFFNSETSQCDSASFSMFATPGVGEKMTKDRRRRLNALVAMMNDKLRSVVDSWTEPTHAPNYWPNARFIDYDRAFDGHRLCEEGVSEPQRGSQTHESHNANSWIFQISKYSGTESFVGANDAGKEWADGIRESLARNPSLQLNPAYADLAPVNPGTNFFSGGYPLPLSKIFHPTAPGHQAIANEIMADMEQAIQAQASHQYGQIQYGPSKFCQGLSPGSGDVCMDIKEGCYIVVPEWNTVPTPVCD